MERAQATRRTMARGPGISWCRLERGIYQEALEGLLGHLYDAGTTLQEKMPTCRVCDAAQTLVVVKHKTTRSGKGMEGHGRGGEG